MDWFSSLIERSEFWNILYILIGFILGQVALVFREWFNNRRLEKALIDEMNTNLHQIEQKQDIIRQMIEALERGEMLPGGSVPSASVVYEHHFPTIIKRLSPIERDNVRHIYTNLNQLDGYLDAFESSFKEDAQGNVIENPWEAYRSRLHDMNESYKKLKKLISAYLEGKPVDIYYRGKKYKGKKKLFIGPLTPEAVDKLRSKD